MSSDNIYVEQVETHADEFVHVVVIQTFHLHTVHSKPTKTFARVESLTTTIIWQ